MEERRCAIEFRSSAAEEWRLPRGRSLIAEENRAGEMGDADDDMVIIGYEVGERVWFLGSVSRSYACIRM